MSRRREFEYFRPIHDEEMYSQTQLAWMMGWDNLVLGKALIKQGLKDQETKLPTNKAYNLGLARITTFNKNKHKIKMGAWSEKIIKLVEDSVTEEDKINNFVGLVKMLKKIQIGMGEPAFPEAGFKLYNSASIAMEKKIKEKFNQIKDNNPAIIFSIIKLIEKKKLISCFDDALGDGFFERIKTMAKIDMEINKPTIDIDPQKI